MMHICTAARVPRKGGDVSTVRKKEEEAREGERGPR